MASYARSSQNGGCSGCWAHTLQAVYTARDRSLTLPSVRLAPLAASLPFSDNSERMFDITPSRIPCVSSA